MSEILRRKPSTNSPQWLESLQIFGRSSDRLLSATNASFLESLDVGLFCVVVVLCSRCYGGSTAVLLLSALCPSLRSLPESTLLVDNGVARCIVLGLSLMIGASTDPLESAVPEVAVLSQRHFGIERTTRRLLRPPKKHNHTVLAAYRDNTLLVATRGAGPVGRLNISKDVLNGMGHGGLDDGETKGAKHSSKGDALSSFDSESLVIITIRCTWRRRRGALYRNHMDI